MHEFSVARALMQTVERRVAAHGATAVHRVCLRVGEASGIEVDLLRSAFELVRERTPCASAVLEIDTVPAVWTCPQCDRRLPRDVPLRCPRCREPARLVSGDEILLSRLELEVDHV